jgi:hypothetical protein
MKTLDKQDDYEITLHTCSTKQHSKLVVTFGGQPSGLASSGFGTDFVLSMGFDTIHVAQKFGTQYQGLSIKSFHTAVSPLVKDWDDVITYGSSLGGYAALYYGGSINARCIAAAPMLPAWRPLKIPAYKKLEMSHLELIDVPVSKHDPVVIFDPCIARDLYLIENMVRPAYPNLREVRVPYAGHTVLVTLSQARLLRPIIESLIKDDKVINFERPAEGTAIWHGEKGSHLMRSDPAGAKKELLVSLSIRPSKRIYNQLIQCLIKLEHFEDAQVMLDQAKASGDKNYELFPPRAKSASEAGLKV